MQVFYLTMQIYSLYYSPLRNKKLPSNPSFKANDANPVKKLLWVLRGDNNLYKDSFTQNHLVCKFRNPFCKWVMAHPSELLQRSVEDAIHSIYTITGSIPNDIQTPNFGDNWGRYANYIEINPRAIATMEYGQSREGILNTMKLLSAIPASEGHIANCIILSQLFPALEPVEYPNQASSLYGVRLNKGISKNLTSDKLYRDGVKVNDEEMIKAFNDLAHLRGLKTGFRMPIASGQILNGDGYFNWNDKNDEEAYINNCVKAINLGFDSIFFDSASHVGEHNMETYEGVGNPPDYQKMQYITSEIRKRSGRNDLSFIGEFCSDDQRYKNLGFNAGTDWSYPDNYNHVLLESKKQAYNHEYAAGPSVSNDNDRNNYTYEQRIERLSNALNAYEHKSQKLPVFMQMHDLFPLAPFADTHDLMMNNRSYSTYGDSNSHWNNLFAHGSYSDIYREKINWIFANS